LRPALGDQRLGVVVVPAPRRLERVRVSAHSALNATDLLAIAFQDDVLGISATLGAIGLGFPAVIGALATSKMALEDLIHRSISGLHAS
jgi:hypothetical protein